ncbi:diguanylate cyclase [Aneurinibacillus sp. BA2021]|nr:diguanylate cyclase [Aneurinibacillus sp. BA2021]
MFQGIQRYVRTSPGGQCLRQVAQTLEKAVLDCLVARYGGEEFAVLLPNANMGEQIIDHIIEDRLCHPVCAILCSAKGKHIPPLGKLTGIAFGLSFHYFSSLVFLYAILRYQASA